MAAENPGGPAGDAPTAGLAIESRCGRSAPVCRARRPDPDPVAAHVRGGAGGDQGRERERSAASTSPPRPLARLLDQGFELGDPLVDAAIVGIGRTGRRDDHHGVDLLIDDASISSVLRIVKVDRQDPTDLYEQVAAEIRRAIADGEAKPGERLPPAKDLAAILGVNTNTVLRSLRLLRDEGLLEFRRGRGISVAGTPERGAVVQRTRELVEFARRQGYRTDELIAIIEDVG